MRQLPLYFAVLCLIQTLLCADAAAATTRSGGDVMSCCIDFLCTITQPCAATVDRCYFMISQKNSGDLSSPGKFLGGCATRTDKIGCDFSRNDFVKCVCMGKQCNKADKQQTTMTTGGSSTEALTTGNAQTTTEKTTAAAKKKTRSTTVSTVSRRLSRKRLTTVSKHNEDENNDNFLPTT